MSQRSISIVMPIYNEEALLAELFSRMSRVFQGIEREFGLTCEWVLVNDGSRDRTLEMLRDQSKVDARLTIIDLSRNFGHQPAIQAGLEHATGDAVIVMDGDLQDPPELIPELIQTWLKGSHVVVAKRRSRAEGGVKGFLFKLFHRMMSRMSDMKMETDSGVFGLMDQRALRDLLQLRERNRFLPGLRSWVGYDQATVLYDREERAAGAPKQTFGRLVRYAFDAIFSFSLKPLRAIWTFGFIVSLFAFAYAVYLLGLRIFHVNVVPGFTTPTVAILLLGGVQLIAIGVLGEYLGRIYDEVKQRPHYIVNEVIRNSRGTGSAATSLRPEEADLAFSAEE